MTMAKKNNTVYFAEVKTLEELEDTYLSLVMAHVDDSEKMEVINAEYDSLFDSMRTKYNKEKEKAGEPWKKTHEKATEARSVLTKLFAFKDAEKDLDFKRDCKVIRRGTWYYIHPNDGMPSDICRKYTSVLSWRKNGDCHYSSEKNAWIWHSETGKKKWMPRQKPWSIEQIDAAYGSVVIKSADEA